MKMSNEQFTEEFFCETCVSFTKAIIISKKPGGFVEDIHICTICGALVGPPDDMLSINLEV